MGLWGNMAERLTGALCKNLIGNLLKLPKMPFPLQITTPKLPLDLPINKLPANNLPGLGGLLGGGKRTEAPKQVVQVTRKPASSKPSGGFGSLFGGL